MAHTCPECGCCCYCGGDIDDCEMDADETYYSCTHCDGADNDDGPLGAFGCLFPEKCCMPGLHYESECYTAEDAEAMEAAARQDSSNDQSEGRRDDT